MLLNYQYSESNSTQTPIVFIHGLFGSLSNLGMLARHFAETRAVIQIDVRNHGRSGHSDEVNYEMMANDLLETLSDLEIKKFIVVGHSMGGKIAMKVADLARDQIESLVVLDMAPYPYVKQQHIEIFKALFAVEKENVTSRLDATNIMKNFISEDMVIQFLLKSFNQGQWLFNVKALYEHYTDIMQWESIQPFEKPSLFLRGEHSNYISQPEHLNAIAEQFTQHKIEMIEGTGHWLHAEKPNVVIEKIKSFLN